MKAKDLKLGDIAYRPDTDIIKSLKVVGLGIDTDGDVLIRFKYESCYDKGHKVKPDAEAIMMEHEWMLHIYFSLDAAQTRQRRLRDKKIEESKRALEKAAENYAKTLAQYKDTPLSTPEDVR
jgi:hypothetical protein